jgi:hypothetical protein
MGKLMKPRTYKRVGKFQFKRPPSPKIRRNEGLRKRAVSGRLTTRSLENFIISERNLGYPIKYSKPIGFSRRRKRR